MDPPERQLAVSLDGILDASCSDSQRREFAQLIECHPELAAHIIEQLRIHSYLQWQLDGVKVPEVLARTQTLVSTESRNEAKVAARSVLRRGGVAAMLMVAAGWVVWWNARDTAGGSTALAELVDASRVVWSEKTTALKEGRLILPGRLETESGTFTLRFRSGPTVLFSGATSVRLDSPMLIHLDRGKATAQVPHWAKGFTIETADVEVVDLGTQFGVMARDDGMTDVVIFEGQVDLKPTAGSRRIQKRLIQGEAARINNKGAINRIMEVRRELGGGWSTIGQSASGRGVFQAIRDNIPPSDGSKYYYYQITTAALEDDAQAYVDRHPHEWNGLDAGGLPAFLRGADYARTFNDYRYIKNFEIVVELAQAANLYVFFDDRVPTPEWLRDGFEDTGVDIGLDEGPYEGIPDHVNAVGSGNSIDNIFSVWRRRCAAGQAVRLGAVGESSEARAMYGIAATPLKPAESATN